MASARQQIRIAIALAALRHKPPTQSIPSYILDLQSAFPVSAPQTGPNRPPSPNLWRQRVLVLEKDLQDLQSQYDKEKIELLALRKAAVAHAKQTKKRTRDTENAQDTTDAPGRKGRQKRQKPAPVVCATDGPAPPTTETEPRPRSRPDLGAVARSLFGSDDVPTAPAVLAALESFDALADVLAADTGARAVPLDLLLATTRRAFRALGALLSACLPCSSSGSSSSSSSGSSSSSRSGSTFVCAETAKASGIGEHLRALGLLDASLRRVLCAVFAALPAHLPTEGRGQQQRMRMATTAPEHSHAQAQAALDDVLGGLYALVLAPLVRAFAPASEAFIAACLGPGLGPGPGLGLRSCSGSGSGSGFGFGPGSGSGSGISYRGEYPLPGAGDNSDSSSGAACDNDKDRAAGATMPDLRPAMFDVLERALSLLEHQSQSLLELGMGKGLGSSGAEAGSVAGASGPTRTSGNAGTGDGGHAVERVLGLRAQAIRGVREVKRLLALDCVRELERMYTSTPSTATGTASVGVPCPSPCLRRPSAGESSEDHPDASTRTRTSRSDVPPGGCAGTRQGQGTPCHSLTRLALWPVQGSARAGARRATETHAHVHRSRGGANQNGDGSEDASEGEDPLRPSPGTPASPAHDATSSALGPLPRHQIQEYSSHIGGGRQQQLQASGGTTATRTRWGAERPRLAGNLGETRASLGPSSDAAALGLSFAQGRAERERERGDRDLRGDDGNGGGFGRVVRLARKDAVWYLCAVLNRLLSGPAATTVTPSSQSAPGSSSNANASSSGSRPGAEDVNVDIAAPAANPNANANARGHASASVSVNPNGPKPSLTNASTDDTDTIADEAVYAALADLLRRTRPAQSSSFPSSSFFPLPLATAGGCARGGGGSDPSESGAARADTAEASSIRGDDGSSAGGADRHARQRTRSHAPGGGDLGLGAAARPVEMGEVERGMLLAVFERAWLGL